MKKEIKNQLIRLGYDKTKAEDRAILVQMFANTYSKALGITPRQFIVLQTIDFQPGSNQNEIVKSINIDRSTLSKIIQKLETKNYISSQHRKVDKRHKEIGITSKGRNMLRRLQQNVKELENSFIREIELDTKKKFLSSLRTYVTNK